jgi:hypothetical protein
MRVRASRNDQGLGGFFLDLLRDFDRVQQVERQYADPDQVDAFVRDLRRQLFRS